CNGWTRRGLSLACQMHRGPWNKSGGPPWGTRQLTAVVSSRCNTATIALLHHGVAPRVAMSTTCVLQPRARTRTRRPDIDVAGRDRLPVHRGWPLLCIQVVAATWALCVSRMKRTGKFSRDFFGEGLTSSQGLDFGPDRLIGWPCGSTGY